MFVFDKATVCRWTEQWSIYTCELLNSYTSAYTYLVGYDVGISLLADGNNEWKLIKSMDIYTVLRKLLKVFVL